MTANTPTTIEVREAFQYWGEGADFRRVAQEQGEEFDRWLVQHDAQVLADAANRLATHNFLLPKGHASMGTLVDWLRAEADRLEAQE